MKVKYSNQVATGVINDDLTNDVEYKSLESLFPDLEAGDAIMIKRVQVSLDLNSYDVGIPVGI